MLPISEKISERPASGARTRLKPFLCYRYRTVPVPLAQIVSHGYTLMDAGGGVCVGSCRLSSVLFLQHAGPDCKGSHELTADFFRLSSHSTAQQKQTLLPPERFLHDCACECAERGGPSNVSREIMHQCFGFCMISSFIPLGLEVVTISNLNGSFTVITRGTTVSLSTFPFVLSVRLHQSVCLAWSAGSCSEVDSLCRPGSRGSHCL